MLDSIASWKSDDTETMLDLIASWEADQGPIDREHLEWADTVIDRQGVGR